MARNGNGSYTPPTNYNPVISGTVIEAEAFNGTINDISNALSASLPRNGEAPMTGPLKLAEGSVGAPALSFNADASTGLFRPATGTLAIAAAGAEQARFTSGNLLLGSTVNSGEKLQVTGTVKINGTTVATGSITAPTFIGNVSGITDYGKYMQVADTRSVQTGPDIGPGNSLGAARFDFKTNSTDGLVDGGSAHAVLTVQPWQDASGGGTNQLAFTDNANLFIRGSGIQSLANYGAWKRILDSTSIAGYAPSLTGAGASGTWNINILGGASFATNAQNSFNLANFVVSGRNTSDVNLATTTGFYGTAGSNPNSPSPYISVINANNADTSFQMAGGYNSGKMWFRGGSNNGAGGPYGYTQWNEVISSANIAAQSVTNSTLVGGFGVSQDGVASSVAIRNADGSITASGAGGFKSGPYVTNARNPIWRFSNSEGFGLSYFQGTAGKNGLDAIGFHFGNTTMAGSVVNMTSDGTLFANAFVGNGANITGTAPNLNVAYATNANFANSATNATNATNATTATNAGYATNAGNASTLTNFTIQGRTAQDFNSAQYRLNGHFAATETPANCPTPYASLLSLSNSDVGMQLAGGYNSDNMYFRGWYSSGTYTPWRTVYHSGNLNVMNSGYVAGSIPQRDGNGDITAHSFVTQGTGYFLGSGAGLTGTAASLTAGGLVTNPTLNGTINIGRTLADFGSTVGPAYSFKSDTDSGMFSRGDGYVSFAANNQLVGEFLGPNFTVTGNIAAFSDSRLKKNWVTAPKDFVARWAKVQAGTYDRIDYEETQVGVVAQDVQAILPHAVAEDKDGMLSLNYGGAAAVATVELAKEVVSLREIVAKQQAQIDALMAKLGG